MCNNPMKKEPRADPKPEAISSLVLGVITVVAAVIMMADVYFDLRYRCFSALGGYMILVISMFSWFWGWLFAVVGLALGLMALKSRRRRLAITGTILSSMALVTDICFSLYELCLFQPI